MSFLLFYVPCKDHSEADKIAKELIYKKYAACVNLLNNIDSYFLENNELKESTEVILIAKTTLKNKDLVTNTIKKLHSYETPAIISIKSDVNDDFKTWLLKSLNIHC